MESLHRYTLMMLSKEQKKKGVIAASAGNHALALAYHGGSLGKFYTMLQKLSKCEIKARLFFKFCNLTVTQILREIKFWRIQTVQKCHFWQF